MMRRDSSSPLTRADSPLRLRGWRSDVVVCEPGEDCVRTRLHLQAIAYRELTKRIGPDALDAQFSESVARWARSLSGAEGATVTALEGDEARYIAAVAGAERMLGRRVQLETSFTGLVVRGMMPRFFRPESAPNNSRSRAASDEIRVGIVAPILCGGEVIGTIGIASPDADRFDEDTLEEMGDLGRFVGALIDSQRECSLGPAADLIQVVLESFGASIEALRQADGQCVSAVVEQMQAVLAQVESALDPSMG